jgi:cation transport ATPase
LLSPPRWRGHVHPSHRHFHREALAEREPEAEYICQAVETENFAGRGLAATVEGRRICVGSAH